MGTNEASEERGRRGMHVYPHTHTHTHCVPFLCRSCLTTPHTDELKAWGQKEHVSLKVDLVIQSKAVRL